MRLPAPPCVICRSSSPTSDLSSDQPSYDTSQRIKEPARLADTLLGKAGERHRIKVKINKLQNKLKPVNSTTPWDKI
jgi:hypothetical protein